jgi:hypothetical protein
VLGKLIDEFVQGRVRFRVFLLRALFGREEQVGTGRRCAPGEALDHLLVIGRGFCAGEESGGVSRAAGGIKFVTSIAESAEHEHGDHDDDGRFVLVPEKVRLERGISGDL